MLLAITPPPPPKKKKYNMFWSFKVSSYSGSKFFNTKRMSKSIFMREIKMLNYFK